MPKVYVVQDQLKMDSATRKLVSKFDLRPAEKYGEVEFLLSSSIAPFNPNPVLEELRERLQYITSDDYLLLVGNPTLMALTAIVAAEYTNQINFLQWSHLDNSYTVIETFLD